MSQVEFTISQGTMDTSKMSVPHNQRLRNFLQPGSQIVIRGVHSGNTGASINLTCDDRGSSAHNILLHISIRYQENCIVLNSRSSGSWQSEERHRMPFTQGQKFDLRIIATGDKFELYANFKHLANFAYRAPLSIANHLFIEHLQILHAARVDDRYLKVPYLTGLMNGRLMTGQQVLISGQLQDQASMFAIDLKSNNGSDIALHINPRFEENAITLNSFTGSWGNEQRERIVMQRGEPFDVIVYNEQRHFTIFINGEKLCTYAHRTGEADGIEVKGDLKQLFICETI